MDQATSPSDSSRDANGALEPDTPVGIVARLQSALASTLPSANAKVVLIPNTPEERTGSWSPEERLIRWLGANQRPLQLSGDTDVLRYIAAEDTGALTRAGARTVVPVLNGTSVLGVITIDRDLHADGDRNTVERLMELGRTAGAALAQVRRREADTARLRAEHHTQQLTVAGRLAAEIAHEIRNPLAAIKLTIQSITAGELAGTVRDTLLARTLTEIERIETTVSGLLNLSRPESLATEPANLADLAQATLEFITPLARRQHVQFEIDLAQPVPVVVDTREMQKVFLNLCMNALQAMPHGGRLRISSGIHRAAIDGPAYGHVAISDSGPGLPTRVLERGVEPFFTTKRAGTGLGLAVSTDIVTRHHGILQLSNAPHGGAIATVSLPLSH